jgi:hypothetical protein
MTDLAKLDHDLFKAAFEAGLPAVATRYFERLAETETHTDDLRKALELGVKVKQMDKDRTDNLMTVSWTINGGTITMDVKPHEKPLEILEDVTDVVVATDATDVAVKDAVTPETAFLSTFTVSENLLDDLE